jgi:hypothetical protein
MDTTDSVELLLHPVRLRIVHAFSGGRTLTTHQLLVRMPDVSKASMYRQVGLLADGGLLEVESEQKVGGIIERRYRLCQSRAVIDAETAAVAALEDYRRAFTVAMAALLGEFNAYLARGRADPIADAVGFQQLSLWLSEEERTALMAELRNAIVPRLEHTPTSGRRHHLLSPILFPIEDVPPQMPDE